MVLKPRLCALICVFTARKRDPLASAFTAQRVEHAMSVIQRENEIVTGQQFFELRAKLPRDRIRGFPCR